MKYLPLPSKALGSSPQINRHRTILRRWLLASAFLAAFLMTLPGTALADRGRPVVTSHPQYIGTTYATFVSDIGSLLRGPRWSTDITNCSLPSRSQVTALRSYGFNALHVYAESFYEDRPAGYCDSAVKSLVDWTGQDGLYLVLTIGNGRSNCDPANEVCDANGSYDRNFATDFWNHYAPLYANRTHVLYEIQNEPAPPPFQPSPAHLIDFERDMYNLIRSHAPNTPILLFSYAKFKSGSGVMQDVQALGSSVDWSNAAIAFHGYATPAETEATLNTVVGNRIPVVETEFHAPNAPSKQDAAQTILYEDRFTSWFTFLKVTDVFDNAKYKTPLNQAWAVWPADFGTWPAKLSPPTGQVVSLESLSNNLWVSAVNGGADPLRADSSIVGTAQKFQVVPAPHPRYVGLKALVNGKFVTAASAGSGFLIADRTSVAWWESFLWMKRTDGTVVLKARANHKIVSSDLELMNPPQLIANRKAAGPWERFNVTVY